MLSRESKKQVGQFFPKSLGERLLTPEYLDNFPYARLFGYGRVSTEEQSLDMQITMLLAAGVQKEDLFCDKLSATNAKRPALHLMVKQIQRGDFLAVYSISRLFRKAVLLLTFFEEMAKAGVEIISLTESLDLKTSNGRMMATILAAVDQHERERVSDRTTHGMAEKVRQGQNMGRPRLVTPEVVVQMKAMKANRVKPATIAVKLNVSKSAVYAALKSN